MVASGTYLGDLIGQEWFLYLWDLRGINLLGGRVFNHRYRLKGG